MIIDCFHFVGNMPCNKDLFIMIVNISAIMVENVFKRVVGNGSRIFVLDDDFFIKEIVSCVLISENVLNVSVVLLSN